GFQIGRGVRTVSSLHAQFTDTLQVVVDFVQRAFGRLSDRDTVVGVTGSLCQALDVGCEAVGNGLASSVVFGAVNAQARRQAFNGSAQSILRFGQVVLRNQSQVVGIDNRH